MSKGIGLDFEVEWAKRVGGRVQPGSGSKWYARLDVDQPEVLWSCKATSHESYRLTKADLDEVGDAVNAPGGKGGETIPAMAIRLGDPQHDVVVLRAEDFLSLVRDGTKFVQPDKSEQKRTASKLPQLFRSTS